MSQEMKALETQIRVNISTEASVVVLIKGIADQITATRGNPTNLQRLSNDLKISADNLAAAVVANTLVDPTVNPTVNSAINPNRVAPIVNPDRLAPVIDPEYAVPIVDPDHLFPAADRVARTADSNPGPGRMGQTVASDPNRVTPASDPNRVTPASDPNRVTPASDPNPDRVTRTVDPNPNYVDTKRVV
jgi:hypothetical protein